MSPGHAREISSPDRNGTARKSHFLPLLAPAFAGITSLDTSIFMKTMMRQRAAPAGNSRLTWHSSQTPAGAPVDNLFADNLTTVHGWYADMAAPPVAAELLPA